MASIFLVRLPSTCCKWNRSSCNLILGWLMLLVRGNKMVLANISHKSFITVYLTMLRPSSKLSMLYLGRDQGLMGSINPTTPAFSRSGKTLLRSNAALKHFCHIFLQTLTDTEH